MAYFFMIGRYLLDIHTVKSLSCLYFPLFCLVHA